MSVMVLALLVASTALVGVLAGASLDQSFKQLPSRRRLGAAAFSRYSRAADLANGVPFYAVLGIGSFALSLALGIAFLVSGASPSAAFPIYCGIALSVAHTLATARAAPINFSQLKVPAEDEAALGAIQNRFARWQGIRCVLQCANFGVYLWAIVAGARG